MIASSYFVWKFLFILFMFIYYNITVQYFFETCFAKISSSFRGDCFSTVLSKNIFKFVFVVFINRLISFVMVV